MAKKTTMKGCFISLDGIEGAGKTTQLENIRQWCAAENIEAVFTREPGGTDFGERLRSILLDFSSDLHPISELLLLLAARREHLEQVIIPALQKGQWVVSDRFSDSSYAYQHFGRQIPLSTLQQLEAFSGTDVTPDVRFILGVSLETSMKRLQSRGRALDRFERENAAFFARVAEGYRAQAEAGGIWIDCEDAPDKVFARIRPHLEALR